MRRVLDADPQAEEELGRRLLQLPRMLRAANSRMPFPLDEDEFLDRIQEATYTLLRRLPQYDGRATLETWAYGFCRNFLLDGARRRSRRHALVGSDRELDDYGAEEVSVEDPTEGIDVDLALRALSEDEREVVRSKHYDGETFEALSARLGISQSTAKTRYYRGMLKLRAHLEARYPDLFEEAP